MDHKDALKCPRDGADMVTVVLGEAGPADGVVEVDRCPTCGCVWFDALELDRVLAITGGAKTVDAGNAASGVGRHGATGSGHAGVAGAGGGGVGSGASSARGSSSGPRRLKCPVDHSDLIAMSDLKQPHVRTDACTVCGGILCDPGEVRDLAEFSVKEWWKLVMQRVRN
ncbi:MAG: hypothetical protein AMXMBFR58_14920 [Phycisphaerae bacterium]